MVIISQKADKHVFIGPLDRNQRKNLRSFTTFMQNKANFQKSQMNANLYNTTDYENKSDWTPGENKPNSKPIKPNFQKAQMNVNSLITKDYRKNDAFVVRKNKPNSNPIFLRIKLMQHPLPQRIMNKNADRSYEKTKPIQSQFQTGHLSRYWQTKPKVSDKLYRKAIK